MAYTQPANLSVVDTGSAQGCAEACYRSHVGVEGVSGCDYADFFDPGPDFEVGTCTLYGEATGFGGEPNLGLVLRHVALVPGPGL